MKIKIDKIFHKPVNSAVNMLSGFVRSDRELSTVARAAISLMGAVLWADGKLEEREIDSFREILLQKYSPGKVDKLVAILRQSSQVNLEECCAALQGLSYSEQRKLITTLIELGFANDDFCQAQLELLEKICDLLHISRQNLQIYIDEVREQNNRKKAIVQSGTGIIVALIVILLFILAATFLKSVFFGLILAYLLLPLEKFYERKFATSPTMLKLFAAVATIFSPFKKLAQLIRPGKQKPQLTPAEEQQQRQATLVNRATTSAVTTLVVGMMLIVIVASVFSFNYASGISSSLKKWLKEQEQTATEQTTKAVQPDNAGKFTAKLVSERVTSSTSATSATDNSDSSAAESVNDYSPVNAAAKPARPSTAKSANHRIMLPRVVRYWLTELEKLKPRIEKIAAVKWGINQVSQYLDNEKNQQALLSLVMKKSTGVFAFTAGFLAKICSLLLEILLTIFFLSLFLNQMALFSAAENNSMQPGEYFVKAVFNSKWMPQTSDETLNEAKRIITTIIGKLRTWLKGYLSIIAIETTIYIIGFAIIGVPYAIILGMIAGSTVLLPYIGPLASALLTSLVCLALGGDDVMLTIAITGVFYLIMNGVVEQLFLYPTLVGEALGLTTLETIIVVLLGGIFAGLFGMIFAVPAASILKYLIPQVYRCWQH